MKYKNNTKLYMNATFKTVHSIRIVLGGMRLEIELSGILHQSLRCLNHLVTLDCEQPLDRQCCRPRP